MAGTDVDSHREAYFRALVEAMEDLAYVCGRDFAIEYMNPAMERYLGRSALGEPCHRAFFQSDVPCAWCRHGEVLGGRTVRHEITCPRDGRVYAVTCTPVRAGVRLSSLNILHDITSLRHTQAELEKTNAQLLQAQKMEAMGTLAGGIAHDFNNLLAGVLGAASVLKTLIPEEGEAQRYLSFIETAGERGADLCRRLLTFSRRGRGEARAVDLNRCVDNVVSLLSETVDRGIELEVACEPGLAPVFGDPALVEQVLMNLAINAVQAMGGTSCGKAGGRLALETFSVEPGTRLPDGTRVGADEAYVAVRVTDTGCGMPEGIRSRIFDPFFTTKEPGKGTGLGLAVVYGVVQDHGGQVEVESRPGEGSSFTVYLPRADHEAAPAAKTAPRPGGSPKGVGTILVVDDEPMLLELLADVLGRAGYEVLTAGDGVEALRVYEAAGGGVDLVVLDVMMPGMNGLEVFRRLREMDPKVQVLFASGYAQDSQMRRALDEGACGFIAKPFSVVELGVKVRRALKGRRGRARSRRSGAS
ncbi:response regulator [Dissulfurirhabdus thermomarina]|uniref:histidine kinase n=1 Tax=Dissulfurirhabdus thermomarina TaxID=1765737 RepID=A0A6N9TQF2_DISTH|nr:response regulator [Dissulfurirhabdus thermomarina]NDY43409.1 response regulator [Dissulfurirhabdus thermomarina]NMX23315.1 response regulator [Dissulfurirhabdus thermomarina]